MRWLAVDLGKKRIGLAVGESDSKALRALPPLPAIGTLTRDADQVIEAAVREEATGIVLGWPLHADGSPAPITRVMERFAEILREKSWEVSLVNETGSSRAATQTLQETGMKGSQLKRRLDSEVACRLLEEHFSG